MTAGLTGVSPAVMQGTMAAHRPRPLFQMFACQGPSHPRADELPLTGDSHAAVGAAVPDGLRFSLEGQRTRRPGESDIEEQVHDREPFAALASGAS